jgi:hypothetical protein
MKQIKFNKYINKIGIEFEGLYYPDTLLQIKSNIDRPKSLLREAHQDGSVGCLESDRPRFCVNYFPYEVTTKPLMASGLSRVLKGYREFENDGKYYVNETVGLHFHISLKNSYYYFIDNPAFFKAWLRLFEKTEPEVYQYRKTHNHYCSPVYSKKNHYTLSSPDRYHMVNYCYKEHTTVEFRGYGGKYATIEGLSRMIQGTINLIEKFVPAQEKKYHQFKDEIATPKGKGRAWRGKFDLEKIIVTPFEHNIRHVNHHRSVYKIRPLDQEPEAIHPKNNWEVGNFAKLLYRRNQLPLELSIGRIKLEPDRKEVCV